MSNLGQRIATASVAIPLIVLICMAGGIWFFLFIALASAAALHEFYALAKAKGARPNVALGLASGFMVNSAFFYPKLSMFCVELLHDMGWAVPFPTQAQLLVIVLLVSVLSMAVAELFGNRGPAIAGVTATVAGVLYVSLFFGTFIGLREIFVQGDFPAYRWFPDAAGSGADIIWPDVYRWGGYTVISVLSTIWICDTAAYHAGLAIGKHKLFPRVSPNKTREGAAAGFIFAIGSALAAKYLVLDYLSAGDAVIIGLIVGTLGQVGDLFESLLKRDAGVKDSSNLLPGHGGVLDRFDSLLFVAPAVYIYIDFIILS
ncbi:MAG TPA: phosphatidate cytidylyltransferase [Bacteroidota bacterium]|nr:phosphatidate cytidylyltransferase [Bacteroidota bacterium]